jgi:signal transduction histidine kinase
MRLAWSFDEIVVEHDSAYTVEDKFFQRALQAEARSLLAHRATHGVWPKPQREWVAVHENAQTLPQDLSGHPERDLFRSEYAGAQGRHYHVLALTPGQRFPMLVAEVSGQLVVRPVRDEILMWLAGWAFGTTLFSLLLAAWVARRLSRPIEALAASVEVLNPAALSAAIPEQTRTDEVGTLARTLQALLERTRAFVAREQSFTRDVSHELRTPLAVMRLGLEATQADRLVSADRSAMLAQVIQMQETADMLLMLSREDALLGTSQRTPVLPLIERWAMTHHAWLSARSVHLDVQVLPGFVWRLPKPVACSVIANLLNNAVRHGLAGSEIGLRVVNGALEVRNRAAEANVGSAGFGLGLGIVARLLEPFNARYELTRSQAEVSAFVRFD